VYPVLERFIRLRERLRPYLHEQLRTGLPLMRPLLLEFPHDPAAWDVEDAFLFGRDLLVAPVTTPATTHREVYLPAGATWTHTDTGTTFPGGRHVTVAAPLAQIPVFLRDNAQIPIAQEE
jgi:alpha-D-xyloside xylohydrolase